MPYQDGTLQDAVILVNTILSFTSIVSVGVRIHRPSSPKRRFDMENVMLFLAVLCGSTMSILQCVATRFGLGSHMDTLSDSTTETFLRLYPAIFAIYYACNMFVKFALLIFYLRTTYERSHRWAIWAMICVAFCFGTSSIIVVIFQCVPPNKLWHPAFEGHCVNVLSFFYANAIIMIVNDTIMYIMPIIFTWNLALRRPQRIVLNLLFALGAAVVLTSILRLMALIRFAHSHGDLAYHAASILIWSAVENHMAIFIACAPSIKALVVGSLVPFVTSVHSSVSEKVRTLRGSQATSQSRSAHDSAHDNPFNMKHHLAKKTASHQRQSMDSDNSRIDLTATRLASSASSDVELVRKGSDTSTQKSISVAVIPMDDLEAQNLPPYTYAPKP